MKLNEDLFWARVKEAIDEKGEMPEFKNSDELTIKKLTYENRKLIERVEDLEIKLDIANSIGSMFMRHNFKLMQLCKEAGHEEIVDKFTNGLRDELKEMERKNGR